MKKYLSIIIPTLNEEKYLPKLLSDLVRQRENDFEVIVVDGNSQDATEAAALTYKKDLNISFYKNDKQNVAYQRNYGASQARGEYLVFLDADTRVGVTFVKALHKEIDKVKGLIFLPYIVPEKNNYQDKVMFNITNSLVDVSQKIGKPFSSGGSMVLQSDFFRHIGGFNEKLFISEDHELVARAYKHGVNAKLLKNVRIKFCLRRMEKEGRLKYLTKYLVAAVETFNKGGVSNRIFSYEMGGAGYDPKLLKNKSIDQYLLEYFKKLKNQVKNLINE